MTIRNIMIVFLVLVFIALAIGFYLYNKPHPNISRITPDFRITSKMLSDAYNEDEALADGIYLGRVIELQGKVLSYEVSSSSTGVVVMEGNEFTSVRCDLSDNEIHIANLFKTGAQVTIRGTCIGLLLDVNMRDCVIVNKMRK